MAVGLSVVGLPDSRLLSQTHFRFTNLERMWYPVNETVYSDNKY